MSIGPVPPQSNPPITPLYYAPSRFVISAISLGIVTIVTTSIPHNYVIGQQVRLLIPIYYGAPQLNNVIAIVTQVPASDQVTLDIFSVNANAFIATPPYGPTPPQILAIGDINTGIISSTGRDVPTTNVPGAFINISPL